jgi:hypothetical protein
VALVAVRTGEMAAAERRRRRALAGRPFDPELAP